MAETKGVSLVEHFEDLEDPRVERTKFHQLSDIIVIAICAVICGADNWVEIEEFGHAKREWLEALLDSRTEFHRMTPLAGSLPGWMQSSLRSVL